MYLFALVYVCLLVVHFRHNDWLKLCEQNVMKIQFNIQKLYSLLKWNLNLKEISVLWNAGSFLFPPFLFFRLTQHFHSKMPIDSSHSMNVYLSTWKMVESMVLLVKQIVFVLCVNGILTKMKKHFDSFQYNFLIP